MTPRTDREERQRRLLISLAVIFGVVLAWRYVVPTAIDWLQGRTQEVQARRASIDRAAEVEVVDVRLDALTSGAATYEPGRNIFGYGPKPRPPAPKPEPKPVYTPPPVAPPPVKSCEELGNCPGPKPPAVPFELVGIFGPERQRIAVLRDGPELINALVGDTVKTQFTVDAIGLQSVDLGFVGFPDETARLDLGD